MTDDTKIILALALSIRAADGIPVPFRRVISKHGFSTRDDCTRLREALQQAGIAEFVDGKDPYNPWVRLTSEGWTTANRLLDDRLYRPK